MSPSDTSAISTAASAAAPARPRHAWRKLGPAFWAGLLFGAVCIFLGLVVGLWGGRLAPAGPPKTSLPIDLPAEPAPEQPARRFVRPAAAPSPPAAPVDPASNETAPADETILLQARLAEAQAAQRRTADAAAATLAVSALAEAAEGPQPFAAPLERAAAALPGSPDIAALRDLAVVGAPSRPALADAFPATAARVAVAARQPGERAGLGARAAYFFSGFLTIRRTDRLTGPGADAVLARAERAVNSGDLAAALRELATLPPAAKAAAGPWRGDVERRLAIEQRLTALRATVAADLRRPAP